MFKLLPYAVDVAQKFFLFFEYCWTAGQFIVKIVKVSGTFTSINTRRTNSCLEKSHEVDSIPT